MENLSDANPNAAQTPVSKKKQPRKGARATSAVVPTATPADHAAKSRGRPASAAVAQSTNNTIATPAKAAYAGPTWHASPAPSSLPVPKFLAKTQAIGIESRSYEQRGNTPPPAQSSPMSNSLPRYNQPATQTDSPLDLLFSAARNERAQQQVNVSSLQPSTSTPSRSITPGPRHVFELELDDAESPAARRANKTTQVISQDPKYGSSNESSQLSEAEECQRATFDLKNLLNLNPAASSSGTPARPTSSGRTQSSPFMQRQTPSQHDNSAALHYGNRNLSPMFHVARTGQTPPQAQSTGSQPYSSAQQSVQPQSYISYDHMNQQSPLANASTRPQPAQSSIPFSLHSQMSQQGHSQSLGYPPNPLPPGFVQMSMQPQMSSKQSPLPAAATLVQRGTSNAPSASDIKGMEDGLRKILKMA